MNLRALKFIGEYKSLLLFFGLMMVFRSAVADWMYVPTGSMNPTIVEGDRILVDKFAYGLRVPFTELRLTAGNDPMRGDIVIFPSPQDGTVLVKRVVGLPGDSVTMHDERLFVNGEPIESTPANEAADVDLLAVTRSEQRYYLSETLGAAPHPIMVLPNRYAMRSFGPVAVPAGQYFMLGDSRDNSKDSRYFGFVPRASIIGRAHRVAYSLDSDRWYLPRVDRFMAALH
ncbi:MAG: signal peptidase I [Rudaea sp.]